MGINGCVCKRLAAPGPTTTCSRAGPLQRKSRQRAVIESCSQDDPQEALRKIAAALRALASESTTAPHSELEPFLRECDDILYAPNGSAAANLPAQIQRALELAEAMMRDMR